MNKYEVRKEIAALIESIKEHSDNIGHDKYVPQLELELILAKIKKLYERSIIFNYLNTLDGLPDAIEPQEKVTVEIPADIENAREETPAQIESEEESISEPPPVMEQEDEVGDESPEVNVEEEQAVVAEEKEVEEPQEVAEEETVIEEPAAEVKEEAAPMNLFSSVEEKPSLSDKYAAEAKEDKSLAGKLKKKPIADLKAAIGINEKFQFINELFAGNLQEYNQAIDRLNGCSAYDDAKTYVSELHEKFKWDGDHEVVIDLMELIERRYSN